jgi:asparagine synthase (glutamine-hydrolysing)
LLSGGLDSSIVATSLCEKSHELICLTFVSQDPVGDERSFASAVADELGVRLVEYHYDLSDVDVGHSITEHLPRPNGRAFMQSVHVAVEDLVAREGVDAIFDGQGGDNVFSYGHSARPIADRLLREGLSAGTRRTLMDVCQMTRCSYWHAAAQTIVKTWQRAKSYRWYQDMRFLNQTAIRDLPEPIHPWLESTPMSLPGKTAHIASVARTRDYLEGGPARASIPWASPLVSQPVMELCLRIPTWNWCEGGRDRALARQAFHDVLPKAVARRTMKGGPDGFMVEIYEANRERLKEILLGGLLERNGVLDRPSVESFLSDPQPPRNSDYHRILSLADAEIWASHWVA